MRRNRLRAGSLMAAVGVGLVLCSCAGQLSSELDVQAKAEARRYWDAFVRQCGDRYFSTNLGVFGETAEYKGFSYFVSPLSLTPADRRNQVEWKGVTDFRTGSYRVLSGGKWGAWRTGSPEKSGSGTEVTLEKRTGRWYFLGNIESSGLAPAAIDCAKLLAM